MSAIRKHLSDAVAVVIMFVVAIGVTGYIISQQASRGTFPFIEKSPYELKAQFSDAQAVIPGQGQTVRVAGVEVGKIGTVEPKNGVAVVTMNLDRDKIDNHELVVRSDATAQLRPRTGLKDMFIELDPGTTGRKLKEHDTLPVQNTEPDVDPDEILSALDTDTRSYLQLLITGLGKGLKGHGKDLNATFKALGPTQRDLKRVSQAVATRRHELARLVHNYADLTTTLATRDKDVHRLIDASNATLSAFAQENLNISSAVSKLPSTLQTTSRTLGKLDTFSRVARPALNSLRPAFRQLDVANHQVLPFVKEAYPLLRDKIRPFVQVARPYVTDLRPAAKNLAKATPDLSKSLFELNRFFNMAANNPKGREPLPASIADARKRDEGYLFWVGWVSHLTDSLFSTSDAQGPFRRALLGFTCDTIRQQAAAGVGEFGPLGPGGTAALLGLTDLVAPTGICAPGASGPKAKAAAGKAATGGVAKPTAAAGAGVADSTRKGVR
ncbi:MAG: phospholipid/cholesterol/gamma-HCH transport system substrate-binding protein [Thermoleophilaceae bacterium]|nr:phospholipid/cholesterol/gamma-HCH transport system substrate-binding protein [Thermoleophilaceae bacterium]MEA2352456.1 phospholipid/cholesterol/gamma-HCH transport system substrate-binding protein [Thermoleophilaceae bacterium]